MHTEFFRKKPKIQNMSEMSVLILLIEFILHVVDGFYIIKQTKDIV